MSAVMDKLETSARHMDGRRKIQVLRNLMHVSQAVQYVEINSACQCVVLAIVPLQGKYLDMLRESPEAQCKDVIEMPELHTEVTGPHALKDFSRMLISHERPSFEKHFGSHPLGREEL